MSTTMNTTYKIAIGADHAGVDLKETVAELLKAWGHEVTDMGTMTKNSCDYSDYANAVASSIADGTNDRGILICRSGIGMSIAANRWVGVRAALCRTAPAAALSRQHNDSNLLCLASAYVDNESVEDVLDAWLHADFEGGRHERRVVKSSGSPLQWTDPELAGLIQEEGRRESNNIELIASENFTSPSVREAQGSLLTNKYAEGYPGKRWYGGCEVVDKVEQLAIDRVLKIFGGRPILDRNTNRFACFCASSNSYPWMATGFIFVSFRRRIRAFSLRNNQLVKRNRKYCPVITNTK